MTVLTCCQVLLRAQPPAACAGRGCCCCCGGGCCCRTGDGCSFDLCCCCGGGFLLCCCPCPCKDCCCCCCGCCLMRAGCKMGPLDSLPPKRAAAVAAGDAAAGPALLVPVVPASAHHTATNSTIKTIHLALIACCKRDRAIAAVLHGAWQLERLRASCFLSQVVGIRPLCLAPPAALPCGGLWRGNRLDALQRHTLCCP